VTPTTWTAPPEAAGKRLDAWLAAQLENVSRARVQLLLSQSKVLVNGTPAKPSLKLRGGETIEVTGEATPPPLRAMAEAIPLDVVYEDDDLSVINKPAGMMVHAGSGATDDARNRGTLVNALLSHYAQLSHSTDPLRPGIVHRLDKQTSGLIIIARNDAAHSKLGEMFSRRQIRKTYIALVHGAIKQDHGTINAPISRDVIRRTRMTTRRDSGARSAVSHYTVLERIDSRFGKFALVSVRIETGRTHQIRVHLASIGHPVVGDTLYGAPAKIPALGPRKKSDPEPETIALDRNFLHAADLEFAHPTTGKQLSLKAPLPEELNAFQNKLLG
jgi:23S rRNA pseudouridine1911/1915/1917 synthase